MREFRQSALDEPRYPICLEAEASPDAFRLRRIVNPA